MDLRLLRCALVATLAILVASQPVAAIRIGTGLLSTSSAGVCRNAAVMHERSPRIVTLFVNVTTNDYTSNAVSDMAFVSDSLRDLDAIRKSMYYSHDGLTMEVNDSTTPDILGSYVRHNNVNVIQGVLTQELALSSSVPILDPIASPSTLLHWGDTTVVYLYATLEQQFFVYSFYAASLKKMPSIRAVLRNTSGMVAVESILNESIQYNRLRLESVVYFEDHVEDALHPLGVSVIVGLKENDVVPLLTFLRQHEEASVVVNFDELTLLYKSICSAYNNAYHSSMRRVLYSTNLPQWSSPPSNPRDVTLSLFFDNIPKNRWTPAALRTFLGSFLLDDLAFTLCLSPQSNLMDDIYTNTIFAQDDDMTFGPFIRQCNYPSNTPSDCRVNYGARNIRLWNLASAFITKEGPLSSPLTVYLSGDDMVINNRNGMGYDNPILTAVLCVMGATIAAFCILACLSARGVFDKSTEMVTVLHVGIQHRFAMQHDGENDYDALLAQFSVAVDELIVSHRCLQLDSSPHGFTAVARHAMDALRLSHDLHDAFRALCEEHSVPRLLTMHMGLHSGLCCCTRALDYGDVAELLQRVAPLSMLAACVSDLCSVSEVLLTKGTHQELGRDGHLSEDVRVHGEYQLDQQPDRVKVFSWKVSEHRRPSERVSKVLSICVQESSAFSFNPLSPEALDVSNSSIGWDAHGTDRVSFIS